MGCSGSKNATSLLASPSNAPFKVAVVGFTAPGGPEMNTDKDKTGVRYDSTPIANGCINAGLACDMFDYTPDDHDGFIAKAIDYDGLIVRINPGQLSAPGVVAGAQKRFDDGMDFIAMKGKKIWSSPMVQTRMGAKDALVQIKDMACGLPDTFAYYDPAALEEGIKKSCAFSPRVIKQNRGSAGEGIWLVWLESKLEEGIKKSCAFSPRVIKQNRGSAGEGIWLVWLESKRYCESFGAKTLTDRDRLKLMEMNDNHIEYHTVKEFVAFCTDGPGTPDAGNMWSSSFPGKYLEGGKAAGGQLVDQRLLPRIVEGEVRIQMVGDSLFQIIHKKPTDGGMSAVGGVAEYTFSSKAAGGQLVDQRLLPRIVEGEVRIQMVGDSLFQIIHKKPTDGGMSAVGGVAEYTFYKPDAPEFKELIDQFISDIPNIMDNLGIGGEPLPILWTADFIPVDDHSMPYVVGEFNCSCVGISKFGAACGPDKDLSNVASADMAEGYRLTNLIGKKVRESLEDLKASGGFTAVGKKAPSVKHSFKQGPPPTNDLGRESTPLPARS
eukprot:CAMPEP_0172651332 /NCGR_PEP_ID=MMETSP1068-20121228/242749_1 /TAXON_ID=35684 /ORGANISM="Pseudopedinella elastica, Strain CCMP716" /LENGTH=549 /DNA_ID=CAMNT_0013465721 /DNA_START=131 /DNA_END=1780 /DNA_ORIENTATION=+